MLNITNNILSNTQKNWLVNINKRKEVSNYEKMQCKKKSWKTDYPSQKDALEQSKKTKKTKKN